MRRQFVIWNRFPDREKANSIIAAIFLYSQNGEAPCPGFQQTYL